MSSTVLRPGTTVGAETPGPAPQPPASRLRRWGAGAIDALVLLGGFALVLATGLAVATEEAVGWALAAWAILFSPLYFALYHTRGHAATPGQRELRVRLLDERTGAAPSSVRALARAYLGLMFVVLVLPALIDVVFAPAGRTVRDRLTRTTVVYLELDGPVRELARPTVAALVPLFEPPAGTRRYLRRGWSLLWAHPRAILGSVAGVYAVLLGVAVVLAFLVVGDSTDPWGAEFATFLVLLLALLASGVYWAQAAVVTAVEEVRAGTTSSVPVTLSRVVERANGLSAALLVLLALGWLASVLILPLLLVGRMTLVAPALVLEDRRVLGALGRSWQLTRRATVRTFGLVAASGAMLLALVVVELLLGGAILSDATTDNWLVLALLGLGVVAVGVVPFVVALAWIGTAWSLLYEDALRQRPPREDR